MTRCIPRRYNDSVKLPTNESATPKLRRVTFKNITAYASCAPDYWRPSTKMPSKCGDNSSIGYGAKARIAPGVFWGLPDSELHEITLEDVTVHTEHPTDAPWRCGHISSVTTTRVSPPFCVVWVTVCHSMSHGVRHSEKHTGITSILRAGQKIGESEESSVLFCTHYKT